MTITPGQIVFGQTEQERFEVIRQIGFGDFGIVCEIIDESGDKFALKTNIDR